MRLKIELCALFGFTVLLKLVTPDSAAKGRQKVVLAHDDPIVKFAVGAINKFHFPRDRPQMTLIKVVKAEKEVRAETDWFPACASNDVQQQP